MPQQQLLQKDRENSLLFLMPLVTGGIFLCFFMIYLAFNAMGRQEVEAGGRIFLAQQSKQGEIQAGELEQSQRILAQEQLAPALVSSPEEAIQLEAEAQIPADIAVTQEFLSPQQTDLAQPEQKYPQDPQPAQIAEQKDSAEQPGLEEGTEERLLN